MRPFKMFFVTAMAVLFFLFIARMAFVAFIAAAVMSIIYAVYRRLKDFITYDRFGEPYISRRYHHQRLNRKWSHEVEPLFYGSTPKRRSKIENIQFIKAV